MNRIPSALRWTALVALGGTAAMALWLFIVQIMFVVFSPAGHWQRPGIAKVTVVGIDWDPETQKHTGGVLVREDGRERQLRMALEEIATLEMDGEVWILHNYYAGGLRPSAFRLHLLRLLLEYPLPLMAAALWGMRQVRRAQARAAERAEAAIAPHRKVWKDEFHLRSQRFSGNSDEPPQDPPAP